MQHVAALCDDCGGGGGELTTKAGRWDASAPAEDRHQVEKPSDSLKLFSFASGDELLGDVVQRDSFSSHVWKEKRQKPPNIKKKRGGLYLNLSDPCWDIQRISAVLYYI